ncbi:MAG TPA: efflux transporter periplasmic adaptor subunit, partial [Casimicrobiaceae bacterium]
APPKETKGGEQKESKGPGEKDGKPAPDIVAQQVFVTTGPRRGDQVAILKGIEPGATVVTSGTVKLKNGTPLVIDNRVQPANSPNPTPQEK